MSLEIKDKFKSKYNKETLLLCARICKYIQENPLITGAELSKVFLITPVRIRKLIQIARENNDKIVPQGYFLISFKRGYKLTNNKKEIRYWTRGQHKRGVSALAQVNQAWKITKENW